MNFERQKNLVERLLDRTRAGELPWQEGVGDDTFQVSFPYNSVQISKIDNYNRTNYFISIIDAAGRTADTFDDGQLIDDGKNSNISWQARMEELFLTARRKALKADEAIDNILSAIS